MRALLDVLLTDLAAFDGSAEDRLQAIGQLRAETWIAALSVIVDTEGTRQAEASLDALTEADSFLVLLALGWIPDRTGSQPVVSLTRSAEGLHRRLERALGRWLEQNPTDPGPLVRAVEAAYRQTLTRTLRGTGPRLQSDLIAIHYAFRRTIISSTLELIASSGEHPRRSRMLGLPSGSSREHQTAHPSSSTPSHREADEEPSSDR